MATILVVDNSHRFSRELAGILSTAGHKVILASHAEGAYQELERGLMPDLVTVDIDMPGTNGFTFCRMLKAFSKTRDIPVLFCTASCTLDSVLEAWQIGATGFMTKPIHPRVVEAQVNQALGYHRDRKRPESQVG